MQPSGAYRTYVQQSFDGEVVGEALFRKMVMLCTAPDQAAKLRTLERLERETKEMLSAEVRALGADARERSELIEQGEKVGARLARVAWPELMRILRVELARYVAEFEAAERLAPPGKESLLRRFTEHERALLEFVDREIAGRTQDSLEPVQQLFRAAT